MGRGKTPSIYPEPLIYEPSSGTHKSTFIILHGRGSTAAKFAPPFLEQVIDGPEQKTLRDRYPNARFVFPTASARRATIYKRSLISQWFDCWQQTEPGVHEELQIEGLRESTSYIHDLLQHEVDFIGAQNVVLGGLSQGCATALTSALLWKGDSIQAIFGLCGWLPFQEPLYAISTGSRTTWEPLEQYSDDGDDPFATSDGDDQDNDKIEDSETERAIHLLREELEVMEDTELTRSPKNQRVFMSHGTEDDRVPLSSGQQASRTMRECGFDVIWKQYDGLGHWYSGPMLQDLCKFLDRQ